MKNNLLFFILVALTITLLAGCYTQVGSTKDDKYSDEYVKDSAGPATEGAVSDDSSASGTDYYFDENGYPRDRYYYDSYYPASMYFGVSWGYGWGWYDGYYGYPYWGYPGYCYNSCYNYPYYYNPLYTYGSYGATRRIGSTRGSVGDTRSRSDDTRGSSTAGATLDLPTGARLGGATAGRVAGSSAKPRASSVRAGRDAVKNLFRGGSNSSGGTRGSSARGGGNVRHPRRPSSPPGYTGSPSQVGGARPAERSAPAAAPSSSQGGSRGGSTGGGGGRGGGRR